MDGELDLAEELAGVLLAAGTAGALLLRHAVVVDGHEELGLPLQADDGELAQGDVDPLALAAEVQIAAEAGTDAGGDLGELAVAGAALAHVHQLHAEDDGVHRLYYPHQIGKWLTICPNHRVFSGLCAHFRPY